MNNFWINDNKVSFEYNGIKLIQCDNTNKILKLILDNCINLNNNKYTQNNSIVISDLTKTKDLINLTKNSFLFNLLLDELSTNQIIDVSNVQTIVDNINSKAGFEVLTKNDGDLKKLIDNVFEIVLDQYINEEIFKYFLDNSSDSNKRLILINDLSFIKIKDLLKYVNNYDFLILTNDFRRFISSNPNELETLLIIDSSGNKFFDVVDHKKLFDYLELKTNILIDNNSFNKIINDIYDYDSIKAYFYIKNLINE